MKPILYLSVLVLSSSVFAITTCPPSGDCGVTAQDLIDEHPVFYPRISPNGELPNPQVEQDSAPGTSAPDTN